VEAQKLIRKTFADEFTKSKLPELAALATKLHEEAQSTKDDLVVRYALFQLASETGARAGDFGLVLKSIDALDQTYAIDALAMKTKVLQDSTTIQQLPPYFRALTDAVMELVEDQVEVDNYKSATQLMAIADAASRRSNSAPHLNRVQLRAKEVAEIAKAYETAKSAGLKLQSSSEDPEASSIWGRFQTFFKGNWGGGLVLLAQSNDSNLKELAAKDLTNPEEAEDQVKLGDAWYKLGESASGVSKKQQWTRAKHWYEMASSKLSGFTKTRVETTMKEIEKLVPKEDATAERPTTTTVPGLVSPTKLAFDRQMSAGIVAMRSGSYEKAVEAFTEALRLMPDDNKAKQYLNAAKYQMHMTRGNYAMNQRRYRDAGTEFQAALEAVPNDSRAQASLKDAQTRDFLRKFRD
jgi:tetratricopeptide (TPR) repeat protein